MLPQAERAFNPSRETRFILKQALDDGVHSYRHVKAITERLVADALQRMDSGSPAPATVTTQSRDLIRSPQEYGELFAMAAASTPQGDLFA